MLRHALFECITQITLVVVTLRDNLGGVTDPQACAASKCFHRSKHENFLIA